MDTERKGPISINKAAFLHGVPPITLKDRLSGRVAHSTKPGPVKYLNDKEERTLAEHLIKVAKEKTQRQVKVIVENAAQEKKLLRSDHISDGWMPMKIF